MSFKRILLLSGILMFSTSAMAQSIVRILCKPSDISTNEFLTTLRSDVIETYPSPTINLRTPEGKGFHDIVDFQSWRGDFLQLDTYFIGKLRSGQTHLYFTKAHIGRRIGESEWVHASRELNKVIRDQFFYVGWPLRMMTRMNDTLVFPGPQEDEFVVMDMTTRQTRSLRLRKNLFNPRFSSNQKSLLFDEYLPKESIIRQVAFDLQTSKVIFETKSKHHTLYLEFNPADNAWVWADVDPQGNSFQLLRSRNSVQTVLHTLANNEVKGPLIYVPTPKGLDIYFAEHAYKTINDPDEVWGRIEFTKAHVRRITLGPDSMTEKSWPYPQSLLNQVKGSVSRQFMTQGFKPDFSDEVFFSLSDIGGLAKLNIQTGQWGILALNNRCYTPTWTLEGALQ